LTNIKDDQKKQKKEEVKRTPGDGQKKGEKGEHRSQVQRRGWLTFLAKVGKMEKPNERGKEEQRRTMGDGDGS